MTYANPLLMYILVEWCNLFTFLQFLKYCFVGSGIFFLKIKEDISFNEKTSAILIFQPSFFDTYAVYSVEFNILPSFCYRDSSKTA